MKRRGFFGSLVAALAAPVLVKAEPTPAPKPAPAIPSWSRFEKARPAQTIGDDQRRLAFSEFMFALDRAVGQNCTVDERPTGRECVQWMPFYQVWFSGFTPDIAAAAGREMAEKINAAGCNVFAHLELPQGVWSAERLMSPRVSARMVVDYDINRDSLPVRIDVWARRA